MAKRKGKNGKAKNASERAATGTAKGRPAEPAAGTGASGKPTAKRGAAVENSDRSDERTNAAVTIDGKRTYLALKHDVIFAIFFSSRRNKEELAGLLKAILKLPDDEYESIAISDPRLLPEYVGKKYAVIDVRLKLKSGRVVHIEIQLEVRPEFMSRVVFYNARIISDQLGGGGKYKNLKQTITIIITDERFVKGDDRYYHRFAYCDLDAGVELTDLSEIHTVELRKLPPEPDGTELYDWAKLIAADTEDDMKTIVKRNQRFKKTVAKLRKLSADERARDLLERRRKGRRDFVSAVDSKTEEYKAQLAEQAAELAGKDSELAEQAAALAGKDSELAEQAAALAEQSALIAELRAKLGEKG
jgi:predicted transposase/invertase (TIGR01784 family)